MTESRELRVTAIVLAAGASSRMGRPKQLLPFGGTTILGAVLDALLASRVDRIAAVLGYNEDAVRRVIDDRRVEIVVNPDPSRGMLSSIQCGVRAADGADAYLIVLGDQPWIRPATIDAVIGAAESGTASLLLPTYRGKRGHPLLLACSLREDVLGLPHSVGLNSLLAAREQDVREVEIDDPDVLNDIDTPEQYAAVSPLSPHE